MGEQIGHEESERHAKREFYDGYRECDEAYRKLALTFMMGIATKFG